MHRRWNWLYMLLPLIPALIYLLLPNQNPGADAWGYAAMEKQWQLPETMHFSPHHLFFHQFGHVTYGVLGKPFMDFMGWMQLLNGLFAGISLFFYYKITVRIFNKKTALLLVFLAGSTFGFIRFAGENETYILPIAFGLAGSFMLAKRNEGSGWIYGGFLLLALSVLFHQIHFWWWLSAALILGLSRKFFPAMLFSLLIIIACYVIAAKAEGQYWLSFPFHDAFTGTVQIVPDFNNFKFTAINLLRTFVQIHGNVVYFLRENYLLLTMAVTGFLLLVWGIVNAGKHEVKDHVLSEDSQMTQFYRMTCLLHLLWAFYSVGNAEFMVMLPFLGMLSFPQFVQRQSQKLLGIATGLLLWNTAVYCIPHFAYSLSIPSKMLQAVSLNCNKIEPVYYISREKVLLENYAAAAGLNLNKMKIVLLSAPSDRGMHTQDQPALDSLISSKKTVITDCVNFPEPQSRGSIMAGNKNQDFFHPFKLENFFVIHGFYGDIYMYKVHSKK